MILKCVEKEKGQLKDTPVSGQNVSHSTYKLYTAARSDTLYELQLIKQESNLRAYTCKVQIHECGKLNKSQIKKSPN